MARKWQAVVIHHSATPSTYTVEQIRKEHVEGNGWKDIGYHYVIVRRDGHGYLKSGRPDTETGAHCGVNWWNANALGICVVGYFHPDNPASERLDTTSPLYQDIVAAVAQVMKKHNIPPAAIKGHKELKATACPGDWFPLAQLKKDVANALKK